MVDPFQEFEAWFDEAKRSGVALPEAVTLATVTADHRPAARVILHKEVSQGGFVFFTNYESRKGHELAGNAHAALVFHWAALEKQIRIEGTVSKVTRLESEAYFATRPRESQLGAWASAQSAVVESRARLAAQMAEMQKRFEGKEVPCPPHWGGFRLIPNLFEFWKGQPGRLHDRLRFRLHDGLGHRLHDGPHGRLDHGVTHPMSVGWVEDRLSP